MEKPLDDDTELLARALAWRDAGARVAIATVLESWGSAPRRPGAILIMHEDGRFEGSVSGGCIEGDVILAGEDVLGSGTPQILEFGISNSLAWERGLACGGKIKIRVEPILD